MPDLRLPAVGAADSSQPASDGQPTYRRPLVASNQATSPNADRTLKTVIVFKLASGLDNHVIHHVGIRGISKIARASDVDKPGVSRSDKRRVLDAWRVGCIVPSTAAGTPRPLIGLSCSAARRAGSRRGGASTCRRSKLEEVRKPARAPRSRRTRMSRVARRPG